MSKEHKALWEVRGSTVHLSSILSEPHAVVGLHRVSSGTSRRVRELMSSRGLLHRVVPNGVYKKVCETSLHFEGPGLIIWGKGIQTIPLILRQFLSCIRDYRYLDSGELLDTQFKVTPRMTNLKLAQNMNFLQKYIPLKPQKGFIEITKEVVLGVPGDKCTEDLALLSRILGMKVKEIPLKVLRVKTDSGLLGDQYLEFINGALSYTLQGSWRALCGQYLRCKVLTDDAGQYLPQLPK